MLLLSLLGLTVLFVAYANGANDNFKGVATLFGSDTTTYRRALAWATGTTLAGSAVAMILGQSLAQAFSGEGLVPDSVASDPRFLIAVGGGAAMTVLLATRIGMPISTTHALLGSLIGAGLLAAGPRVEASFLAARYVVPLLFSPLVAVLASTALYPIFRAGRGWLKVEKETCVCVGRTFEPADLRPDGTAVLRSTGLTVTVGETVPCRERYAGQVLGVSAQPILDRLHFLSAGAVSFARGLNDTPKIAALLIASAAFGTSAGSYLAVGIAIALGGILSARRVAETMSRRISDMNDGQGFSANLATALLVIIASRFGLPVSTTHVSVGSLIGIGLVNRRAHWKPILQVLVSWVVTLPLAAALSAALFFAVSVRS